MTRLRVTIVIFMVACLGPGTCAAELIQPFDLDRSAGLAATIAVGELLPDGTLLAARALKGELNESGRYKIKDGALHFTSLVKDMGADPPSEVIVFLENSQQDGDYLLLQGCGGKVAISKSGKVYAAWESTNGYGSISRRALGTWNKASFMSAVEESVKRNSAFSHILAAPRSTERVAKLIAFLRDDVLWAQSASRGNRPWLEVGGGYFLWMVRNKLSEPSKEEEDALVAHLKNSDSDADLKTTLAIIAWTRCSQRPYHAILPWVEPTVPTMVRKEAFSALASVDPFPASAVLTRFVNFDDPLMDHALLNLCNCASRHEPRILNAVVLETLVKYGRLTLERCQAAKSDHDMQRSRDTLSALQAYLHPITLPILVEWAGDKGLVTSGQAVSGLQIALNISQRPIGADGIKMWWDENRETVQQEHDLTTEAGVRQWLHAWHGAQNPITKAVLMRLWDFQPVIPEASLLKQCQGPSPEAAKQLLSELWQRQRLSPATHKAIVQTFVRMSIKQDARSTVITGDRQFPFPEAAWVNMTGDIASGRKPTIQNPNSGGSSSLVGSGPFGFCGVFGPAPSPAEGVLEIWVTDQHSIPSKDLWRLHWDLKE